MYRIVVVDDDELCRALLEQYIASMPEMVLVGNFADPREALRYAQKNPFDLVVLDVMMPWMNGIELGHSLKRLNPLVVPLLVTTTKEFAYKAYELDAAGYVLKPFSRDEVRDNIERARLLYEAAVHKVYMRTFGHFDVFVNGKPLHFSRQKSKEILAYLVDRRGGMATVDQIIAALWEDRAGEHGVKASYQVAFKDLRKNLRAEGLEWMLLSARNQKAVDTQAFWCDYYGLLEGDERALVDFNGQYMVDYSWAEPTTARCCQLKRHYTEKAK